MAVYLVLSVSRDAALAETRRQIMKELGCIVETVSTPQEAMRAFLDGDDNLQCAAACSPFANIAYCDVNVAMILVKFADLLEIVLQLRFIQSARFIDERQNRFSSRLHLLTQRPIAEMCVAFKTHRGDQAFYPLINGENHAGSAAGGIKRFDVKRHIDIA